MWLKIIFCARDKVRTLRQTDAPASKIERHGSEINKDTMHENTFDSFALSLDKPITLNLLQTATQGAGDNELFFERRCSETVVLNDQRIKTTNFDASEGFGLRAVRDEKIGYGH